MGLFSTIVVGLIAGLLASQVMKARTGMLTDLVLGVVGGILGGWLSSIFLGVDLMTGINITSIVVAFIGAIIVIYLYRLIKK